MSVPSSPRYTQISIAVTPQIWVMPKKARFVMVAWCHPSSKNTHLPFTLHRSLMLRHIILTSILLVCVSVCWGCESSADVEHPKQYTKNGIAFSYPGNWTIESDEVDPTGFRTIIIETPGDGLAMVQHFKEPPAIGLQEYAEVFSELTRQEVPFGQIGQPVQALHPQGHAAVRGRTGELRHDVAR